MRTYKTYFNTVLFCLLATKCHLKAHNLASDEALINRWGYEIAKVLFAIDEHKNFDEVIYCLMQIRDECTQAGYDLPTLSEVALSVPEHIKSSPVKNHAANRMAIKAQAWIRHLERNITKSGFRLVSLDIDLKDFEDIGPHMSDNGAISFCWGLAGTLMLLIPHPAAQVVGGCMIGKALNGLWDELQEQSVTNIDGIMLPTDTSISRRNIRKSWLI